MSNNNNWDFLWDKPTTTSSKEIDKKNKIEFINSKLEAEQKIHKVMRFIDANNGFGVRKIVEKFNLDWSLNRDFGNGIAKVGFYTDESNRFLVMELNLPIKDWFR